ncbi:MAG: hypothetical protein ACKO2V_12280, partial [Snowella sp.]
MFKTLAFLKKINRLGYWTVPVISVASFMPIVAGQWFMNDSPPPSQQLKPIPSPPPVASASPSSLLSPSLLKPPQPKVSNSANVSQPIGTKEKQDRKATPKQDRKATPTTKSKSTAATVPASYKSSSS